MQGPHGVRPLKAIVRWVRENFVREVFHSNSNRKPPTEVFPVGEWPIWGYNDLNCDLDIGVEKIKKQSLLTSREAITERPADDLN